MVPVRLEQKWCVYRKGELALVEERLAKYLCAEQIATPHGEEAERLIHPDLGPVPTLYSVRFMSRFGIYNAGEVAGFDLPTFQNLIKRKVATPLTAEGEAEAGKLLAAEVVEAPAAGTPESEARLDALRKVVEVLDPKDGALWDLDGRPSVGPLRERTGIPDLTVAERDAVWAEFEA